MNSLEEILDALAGAKTDEREALWRQSDLCAQGLKLGRVGGKLAEVLGCSSARVRQLAKAAQAFPDPVERYPDVMFSLYVVAASSEKARSLFDRAVAEEWSVAHYKSEVSGGSHEDKEKCPTCGRVKPGRAA